jgi:trehalose-6-phosphatase
VPALCRTLACSSKRRLLLLDYDGTLIPHRNISAAPPETVLQVLGGLTADPCNEVWVISGRSQQELGGWFEGVVSGVLWRCEVWLLFLGGIWVCMRLV